MYHERCKIPERVNVTLPQVVFKYFASKNQLPDFYIYISGILVENGLIGFN